VGSEGMEGFEEIEELGWVMGRGRDGKGLVVV
jgi:hypothetical protein